VKIKDILKKIIRKDGKHSITSMKIAKLANSKEFDYLVDTTKL
jgi:hypothetical protein